jgi:hypothetical protein
MVSTISRVTNRAKRQVMARFTPVSKIVQNAHDAKVRAHRPDLPPLSESDAALVRSLDTNGVAVTSLDELGLAGTDSVKSTLDRMVQNLADRDPGGESAIKPSHAQLLADLDLWRLGLNRRLLDIAENYIGLPVRYYGAAMYREVADGKTLGTRQFHRDIEDHRMLKILVWLNDVGPRGGAFQYIPKIQSDQAVDHFKYVAGFITDEAMTPVVPADQWVKATGPKWTAVMADPVRLLHRASPAEDRDRYSVTFTWTSRRPIKTMPAAEPFSASEIARIRDGLDAHQLACLPEELQL